MAKRPFWHEDDNGILVHAGLDTNCRLSGFLTVLERPSMRVFESREV